LLLLAFALELDCAEGLLVVPVGPREMTGPVRVALPTKWMKEYQRLMQMQVQMQKR
jgi:hypothetical protein